MDSEPAVFSWDSVMLLGLVVKALQRAEGLESYDMSAVGVNV